MENRDPWALKDACQIIAGIDPALGIKEQLCKRRMNPETINFELAVECMNAETLIARFDNVRSDHFVEPSVFIRWALNKGLVDDEEL